ncbi:MAG: hypothetical protein IKK79_03685, partial [Spirochaetaceae bacterium]|nr:hypothetical protein [Spirochaetaceae bacterium]
QIKPYQTLTNIFYVVYVYIYVYQRVAKRINLLWEQDVAGSNPVIPNIVLRLYGSEAVRI